VIAYFLQRLTRSMLVLLGVMLVTFSLVQMTGDPTSALLGPDAGRQDVERVRHELGFDEPLPIQFAQYVLRIAHGDFGRSFSFRQPALPLVVERLPATLLLASAAMLVNLLISVPLGVISAVRRGSWVDWLGTALVFSGQSMPVFWLGIVLILVLSLQLRLLPPSGFGPENLIMPALVLGLHGAAYQTRLLRSAMLEVLSQDYLRTARSKGLPEQLVVMRHALRNALITVVTASGVQFAVLMGGSVIVETIFAWPGVGSLAVLAINSRDVNLVVTTAFVFAVFILLVNTVVDLSYGWIDPRVRLP
jgi:peptide/nickel transport system permease protein